MACERINASLLGLWRETPGHADNVLRYYGPPGIGGAPRNPRYYLDALTLRDKTVPSMIKLAGQLYNAELAQVLSASTLKRLCGRDKGYVLAVMDDFEAAYHDAGIAFQGVRV